MKVEKYVKESCEINIDGITLLSIEEYEACKQYIPLLSRWWWLRSPGSSSKSASGVNDHGRVYSDGYYVNSNIVVVRPALKISNLEASNLQIGDKFRLFDYDWTVISEEYALCDGSIGNHCFRMDYTAEDAIVYEASDVKRFVEDWFSNQVER